MTMATVSNITIWKDIEIGHPNVCRSPEFVISIIFQPDAALQLGEV